ncbi:hypothetical protein dqs_3802 [Azoarcus olearius]|uniref:DUF4870 family protein n=1 Tax=Azoarcus sp. (strain BH72) TaxID=418699 RepID=UPI000806197C|nr:hypothetical protein [Azoarcus olearius]ANQ86819.1 hypothetical protein dqs_3802 [Azoarcus olearius]
MADTPYTVANTGTRPSGGQLTLTHVMYALHAFAVITGVLGSATIVVSFIASLPSIAAVVLNYWNRGAVRGTWLDSHFRWQLRTFWFAVLWVAVALLFAVTVIGLPLAFGAVVVTGLWVLYRMARGWWALSQRQPLPVD